ncbi:GTPase activating factor [Spiromyces aspiralis]|uniref:GTPase activating factor n=1 Tax=Spiromyces aspiralis TaxID=68401 RepID=A0ACC1I0Z6_9FUNG|nr:GTPase activating factor [Spiromyces aspiralis]
MSVPNQPAIAAFSMWDVVDPAPDRIGRLENQYNALVELKAALELWTNYTYQWVQSFQGFRKSLHSVFDSFDRVASLYMPMHAPPRHYAPSIADSLASDAAPASPNQYASAGAKIPSADGRYDSAFEAFLRDMAPTLDGAVSTFISQVEGIQVLRSSLHSALDVYQTAFRTNCNPATQSSQNAYELDLTYANAMEDLGCISLEYEAELQRLLTTSRAAVEEMVSTFLLNVQDWLSAEDSLFVSIRDAFDQAFEHSVDALPAHTAKFKEQMALIKSYIKRTCGGGSGSATTKSPHCHNQHELAFTKGKRSGYLMVNLPKDPGKWQCRYLYISPDGKLQYFPTHTDFSSAAANTQDRQGQPSSSNVATELATLKLCKAVFGSQDDRDNVLTVTLPDSSTIRLQAPTKWEASAWLTGIRIFTEKQSTLDILSQRLHSVDEEEGGGGGREGRGDSDIASDGDDRSNAGHITNTKPKATANKNLTAHIPLGKTSLKRGKKHDTRCSIIDAVKELDRHVEDADILTHKSRQLGQLENLAVIKIGKMRLWAHELSRNRGHYLEPASYLTPTYGADWHPVVAYIQHSSTSTATFSLTRLADGSLIPPTAINLSTLAIHDINVVDASLFNNPSCLSIRVPSEVLGNARCGVSPNQGINPFLNGISDDSDCLHSWQLPSSTQFLPETGQTSSSPSHVRPLIIYLSMDSIVERDSWVDTLRSLADPCYLGPVAVSSAATPNTSLPQILSSPTELLLKFRVERSVWIRLMDSRGMPNLGRHQFIFSIDGSAIAKTNMWSVPPGMLKWDSNVFFAGNLGNINFGAMFHMVAKSNKRADYHSKGDVHTGTSRTFSEIGYVHVPLPSMQRGVLYDGWYPVIGGSLHNNSNSSHSHSHSSSNSNNNNNNSSNSNSSNSKNSSDGKSPYHARSGASESVVSFGSSNHPAAPIPSSPEIMPQFQLDRHQPPPGAATAVTSDAIPTLTHRLGDVNLCVFHDELIILDNSHYAAVNALLTDFSHPMLILDLAQVAKSRDWLIETFLKVMLAQGKIVEWLTAIIEAELSSQKMHDSVLLFRASSICTQAVDAFMRMVGMTFVDEMIGPVVREVVGRQINCEVDPHRLKPGERVDDRWLVLLDLMRKLWHTIEQAQHKCPLEMQRLFGHIRRIVRAHYNSNLPDGGGGGSSRADDGSSIGSSGSSSSGGVASVKYTCVTGFLFLRLVCPAMLSPKRFGLVQSRPSAAAQRTLTLMAKGIQGLANMSDFGHKEPYMQPMNEFVKECIPSLKNFIDTVTAAPSSFVSPILYSGIQPLDLSKLAHAHTLRRGGVPGNSSLHAPCLVDKDRELASLCRYINNHRDEIRALLPLTPSALTSAAVSSPLQSSQDIKPSTQQQQSSLPSMLDCSSSNFSLISDNSNTTNDSSSASQLVAAHNPFREPQKLLSLINACRKIDHLVEICRNSNFIPQPAKVPVPPSEESTNTAP